MSLLSHWQHTAPAAPASLESLPAQADVLVLGGGLHGVCAAYWLARLGACPLLVEAGPLAAGASGRNGGLMVAGTSESYPAAIARLGHESARAIWQLTLDNHAMLLALLVVVSTKLIGSDCSGR